ncbi:hypothetical protein ACFC01_51835 [Streptomyces mirabilis]|uniref:hypothetical protein n=1 Tax=Streptomyces mirabilis TaxID=68239 RepID=UPI0035D7A39E
MVWQPSGEELSETVHRFALAGLSGIVKPPMSLLGIAALEEVGQTHHRPCITKFSGLLQTRVWPLPRTPLERH